MFYIPPVAKYIWDWYFDISLSLQRVSDGRCDPIPPSEILAWSTLTETILNPVEVSLLRAIDQAYCKEQNIELKAYRERREAEQKAAMELAKNKRGRR